MKSRLIPVSNSATESLMKTANKLPPLEVKHPAKEFTEREKALSLNTSLSRVKAGPSTASFSNFNGEVADQTIEKALLERGFISTEKILTKDEDGNVVCRFIKARDNLGHAVYIELDTTQKEKMGYLTACDTDQIITVSREASVIPYSLKVGSFEASSSSLFGVGFECDNQICVMSRKDNSLEPVETVFSYSNDMGVQEKHPVPFPIVKLSEVLANPKEVLYNIAVSHAHMRNIAFQSCKNDVEKMLGNVKKLDFEVERFANKSKQISHDLEVSIRQLEDIHNKYIRTGARNDQDLASLKAIRFNLNKRADLQSDFVALCHSMRERAQKIAILEEEIRELNNFSDSLFTGLSYIFTE